MSTKPLSKGSMAVGNSFVVEIKDYFLRLKVRMGSS
jgi:hypothetical protein